MCPHSKNFHTSSKKGRRITSTWRTRITARVNNGLIAADRFDRPSFLTPTSKSYRFLGLAQWRFHQGPQRNSYHSGLGQFRRYSVYITLTSLFVFKSRASLLTSAGSPSETWNKSHELVQRDYASTKYILLWVGFWRRRNEIGSSCSTFYGK